MSFDFEAILGLLFFIVFVVLPLVQGNKKKQQQQQRQQEDARSAQQPSAPPQTQASTQHPARSRAAGPLTSQQPTTLSGRPYQAPAPPRQPTTISGPPPPPSPPDSGDPLLATIEEIRRRVRDAQEREDTARRLGGGQPRDLTQPAASTASGPVVSTASGQPRQGSLVGTDPFESTLVSAPGRTLSGGTYDPRRGGAQTPPRSAQTQRPAAPRSPPTSALGREGTSDELRVERLGPVKPTVRPSVRERDPKLMRPFARGLLRPGETDARIGAGSLLGTDSYSIMRGLIWHEVLSEPWILKHRKRRNPGASAR